MAEIPKGWFILSKDCRKPEHVHIEWSIHMDSHSHTSSWGSCSVCDVHKLKGNLCIPNKVKELEFLFGASFPRGLSKFGFPAIMLQYIWCIVGTIMGLFYSWKPPVTTEYNHAHKYIDGCLTVLHQHCPSCYVQWGHSIMQMYIYIYIILITWVRVWYGEIFHSRLIYFHWK